MPRARNPAREKAREMWLSSGKTAKLKDIAAELQLPENRIRKWKSEDKWESERSASTAPKKSEEKKERKGTPSASPPAKKRGGQPNNKNAKGGPPGNKKAVTTGAFETLFFDSFDDEEKELAALAANNEKKTLLQHQITTLLVRERRMLKRISDLRKGEAMFTRTTSTKMEPSGKKLPGGKEQTRVTEIGHNAEAQDDRVIRIEDALTRVQAELRRCVDSLRQVEELEAELAGKNGTGTLADCIMEAYNMRKDGDYGDD